MCAQFVECHRHIVLLHIHNSDVTMSVMASQIASVSIVCPTVCTGANQRKHQSSVSLVFVRGIHRSPVDSPYKRPLTRKMFPFDDVIMWTAYQVIIRLGGGVSLVCLWTITHWVKLVSKHLDFLSRNVFENTICWTSCHIFAGLYIMILAGTLIYIFHEAPWFEICITVRLRDCQTAQSTNNSNVSSLACSGHVTPICFRRWVKIIFIQQSKLFEHVINLSAISVGPIHTPQVLWWRHQMETFSALLALCAGNSLVILTKASDAELWCFFFDLRLNKRLSKQWWGWWFEMPSRPLWRHCSTYRSDGLLCTGWDDLWTDWGHLVLEEDDAWTWWRHQMETFSALLAICAGNSPVPGEFPAQSPLTRSLDIFFDLRLNKRLSKTIVRLVI